MAATEQCLSSASCCAKSSGRAGRLVIIGGGSAAFAAASAAAPDAESVTIVNKGLMGGCCVNVGCVPSKFLVQAAHVMSPQNSTPPFKGIRDAADRVNDFATLTAQNRALVEGLRQEKYANVIAKLDNVKYIEGIGKIVRNGGRMTVEVRSGPDDELDSQMLPADRVIIATGVSNSLPSQLVSDLAGIDYLTNETAYFETHQPESLIVLGGGYVALETAQTFARLGSKVTIVQRSENILSHLEQDIGTDLANHLRAEGIAIEVGVETTSVVSGGKGVILTGISGRKQRRFEASRLFVATGRHANVNDISDFPIETAGPPHGGVIVSNTLQTSVPEVYAAGDCIAGSPQYVYTAAAEGKLAALNALGTLFGRKPTATDYSAVPWVIFTSPAVAGVGLSLSEARSKSIDADASSLPLHLLPRALVQQDTRGFVTLIRDRSSDRIIGARVLAEEGGELIMEAVLAVHGGIQAKVLAALFHPYLTWNEAWKLAALGFRKDVKALSCCAT